MTTAEDTIRVECNGEAVSTDPAFSPVIEMPRVHVPLYAEHYGNDDKPISLIEYLQITKQDLTQFSGQGVRIGRQFRPYDFDAILNFKTANVHHATCINTKVSSTVGQGFLTDEDKANRKKMQMLAEGSRAGMAGGGGGGAMGGGGGVTVPFSSGMSKAAKILDPLCNGTFQQVLTNVAEDFYQLANGYIEVVRGIPGSLQITGLHHLPARDTWVYVEDQQYNYHYEIQSCQGPLFNRRFARFGDKEGMATRVSNLLPIFDSPGMDGKPQVDRRGVSEVIHIKNHNTLSRWYGFADWLSCVPSVELAQCVMQQKYDFFNNRGVPEFFLFILGKKMPPKEWAKLENAIKAGIGRGNSHKSVAVNIEDPETTIKLEKLMSEGKTDEGFQSMKETLAMDVVTAHRTPPLLAGIQIPGKLGANNELPNALMAFQVLVIGPAQHTFQSTLGDTLGNAMDNGGMALTYEDFALKTILDSIDVGIMSTVGAMRQPITGSGRDPSKGLKD